VADLAVVYLSFLDDAFNSDTGRFRNFMSYERNWLEEVGSEDSHGRALWALGVTAGLARDLWRLARNRVPDSRHSGIPSAQQR
jgi:hypothetical protein